ncbi:hypothetical protein [Runella slithyformis]|uniref:DUF2235 domain-containing protein n=1 Tax=Runella slithyformis (strain ATCC 29530 / DSM 19594 / LMG 11500 / NCIMB 11436 / LSU 4) TaxID=761193 RepID=A0A7U3ZQI3_RUNSL|nr:hypothetical protein [Runella slithyformis]AEI51512.1 hypothetical protein Runsl_5212 [Runella slithyformis DSM 19594]
MPTQHILIAIDGTGSNEWRRSDGLNSHVYRFFNDFAGADKVYLDGPGTTGLDVGNIIDEGVRITYLMIERLLRFERCRLEDININIIGHSRGGFIGVKIANLLSNPLTFIRPASSGSAERVKFLNQRLGSSQALSSLKINFIGLYDAVKRTVTESEGDLSLRNVSRIAHSWRQNKSLSRLTFEGMVIPSAANKPFDTSHGGVGGDPGFFTPLSFGNDLYCNALDLLNGDRSILGTIVEPIDSVYSGMWRLHHGVTREERIRQVRHYWQNSIESDMFIREQASQCSVPLSGKSQHLPWEEKNNHLGIQLKRLVSL